MNKKFTNNVVDPKNYWKDKLAAKMAKKAKNKKKNKKKK